MSENKDKPILMTDEELKEIDNKIATGRRRPPQAQSEVPVVQQSKVVSTVVTEFPEEKELHNRSGTVKINFETEGRFDLPPVLFFNDYKTQDINDLSLSRKEELLENLIVILNRRKNQDSDCDLQDATIEELLEILLSMKLNFEGPILTHPWVCECQYHLDEAEQEINYSDINLSNLQYTSISETEQKLRNTYKEKLNLLTDQEFHDYLKTKYEGQKDLTNWSINEESKSIKITEPFRMDIEGKVYRFRFMRIKDLINAQKLAKKKYAGRIKVIQKRQEHGKKQADLRAEKDEEIRKINEAEAKDILLFAKALTLVSVDGVEIKSIDEKAQLYNDIPRNYLDAIESMLHSIAFGLNHTEEFACPICGKVDGRSLRQEFDPLELLPISANTKREPGKFSGLNIHFGI